MKRTTPLQRKTPLRSNPEKTAAFVQRGRGKLKAATAPSDFRDDDGRPVAMPPPGTPNRWAAWGGPTPRSMPLKRTKPSAITVPKTARREAIDRTHGGCVMCLYKQGVDVHTVSAATVRSFIRIGVVARAVQVHHVLPRFKWPHLAKLAANLVGVCAGCHDEHERAHRRFPRCLLPPETLALAEAEGLTWYIERVYPLEAA